MPVQDYGVWKATPVRYTFEGNDQDSVSPHLSLFYTDNEEGEGRAAINIKSGDRQESRLAYWTVPSFTHPITDKLTALDPGFHPLADTPEQKAGGTTNAPPKPEMTQAQKNVIATGLVELDEPGLNRAIDIIKGDAGLGENDSGLEIDLDVLSNEALEKLYLISVKANLDFIRGNLFDRSSGRILPHDVDGPDNDILDELKPLLDRALAAKATAYIFGSAFDDGKGIHNVHQNQGNPARFARDNGVFQDGALILEFPDHFEAVFIGFASQAVHTEDGPGDDAGQPIPRTGYKTWADFLAPEVSDADKRSAEIADSPVLIVKALLNPKGPRGQPDAAPQTVWLHNCSDVDVDLDGWKIQNQAGQERPFVAGLTLEAGRMLVAEVSKAPLSHYGGTITLLDGKGLKVHGVSYTKEQARGGCVKCENCWPYL